MKKRILQAVDRYYSIIGFTEDSFLLYYMHTFLENLSLEEAKKGSGAYDVGGINDFDIGYGASDQDYYVRFSFLWDWDRYTIEINGETITDWDRIPQLKLSYENFDYIFKAWAQIKEQNPKYLIISQDDSGWVGLQGKEELDADEVALAEQCQRKQK